MLPWPVGVQHNIGATSCSYNCPPGHIGIDKWAIDFSLSSDSQVSAVLGGIAHVTSYLCWDSSHTYSSTSYVVWIDHGGGLISYYAHLDGSNIQVNEGQPVVQGQPLALSDNTGYPYCSSGPHLHFAMHSGATTWNNGSAYLPEPLSGFTGFGAYGLETGVASPQYPSLLVNGPVDGLYGDVVGSGLVDLVAVNDTQVFVARSTGGSFNPAESWWVQPGSAHVPYGTLTTLLGDVSGDGKADLVIVDSTDVWVMTSTGSAFSDPVSWSSTPFYGTRATLLGDVTGTGRLDLVAVNETSVWVMLSSGTSFGPPTLWWQGSGTPFGAKATLLADFQGSGKAAVVAVNSGNTSVMTSTGSGFNAPATWTSTPFYGDKMTLAGDADGDGKADLVAIDNGSTWVMTSTGSGFNGPASWSSVPFYGTRATLLAKVHYGRLGGGADVVAVNDTSTWVMTSTGTSYDGPALWSSTPFYGTRATL